MTSHSLRCSNNNTHRVPWYFLTIIAFFILPITFLIKYTKKINYAAFFKALGMIMFLGYCWSFLVTSSGWWVFNPNTMLGFEILPHLPVEEVLFYPLGGALSILVYLAVSQYFGFVKCAKKGYLVGISIITIGSIVATVISIIHFQKMPFYIISQIVLFNGLSIGVGLMKKQYIILKGAWFSVLIMSIIGFFWNWIAFTQTWWSYHATLGWFLPTHVPVDDWNFFVFAPLAAISLYECFVRRRR